jgi:uncharacterized protein YkwD
MSFWNWLKDHFIPSSANAYRPQSLGRDFLVSIIAVVCVVEGFLATSLMLENKAPQFSAAVLESALVSLTNTARGQAREPALTVSPALTRAAQAKAEDMAAQGYFAHIAPDGKEAWDYMQEAGYDYAYAGENLAAHFYDSNDVVRAWLDSPSHRANIMRPSYREIGIGIAHGNYQGTDTVFVVQLFGVSKEALGMRSAPAAVAVASKAATSSGIVAAAAQSPASVAEVPSPVVEGTSAQNIPTAVTRLLTAPRTMALLVLATLLAVIGLAIVFAFFIRIHIQASDMLISGMVVAAFVLTLIAANDYFFSGVDLSNSQAAAIEARSP